MNPKNQQLEVLLLTGTTLTSGELCRKDDFGTNANLTEMQSLEEACWNGFLQTMLPEICPKPDNEGILYLWQINEAVSFLELELGEFPAVFDRFYSIKPHSFFSKRLNN